MDQNYSTRKAWADEMDWVRHSRLWADKRDAGTDLLTGAVDGPRLVQILSVKDILGVWQRKSVRVCTLVPELGTFLYRIRLAVTPRSKWCTNAAHTVWRE